MKDVGSLSAYYVWHIMSIVIDLFRKVLKQHIFTICNLFPQTDSTKLKVLMVKRTQDYNYWRGRVRDLTEEEDNEKEENNRLATQSKQ